MKSLSDTLSNGHAELPDRLRDAAHHMAPHIAELLDLKFPLGELLQSAVIRGRHLRSSIALEYTNWLGLPKMDHACINLRRYLARIELLHAASCILDDVIDGDTIRRGQPSFYARHGLAQALLTAQYLVLVACGHAREMMLPSAVNTRLVNASKATVVGEAVDSFAYRDASLPLDASDDLWRQYLRKTTPSFGVALEFVGIAYDFSEAETELLGDFGEAIGALYQTANDYYDWFEIADSVRGAPSDSVLLTLTTPIIVTMHKSETIRRAVGTRVLRQRLNELVRETEYFGGREETADRLRRCRSRVIDTCPIRPVPAELNELVDRIDSRIFWEYAYPKMPIPS